VTDDAAGTLSISRAAAIPWWVARDALVQFASRGHLEGVLIEPRMSTRLLAYQSIDHAGELAARRLAAWDPALSSLPARTWHGRWAESVLARLAVLELVTLDRSIYDVIVARFAMLLVRSGERATMGPQDELVVQLAQIRGVTLTATPVQLQLALRRTYPVLPHLAVDEFELTTPPVS
jgi:hypothetical protein